MQQCGAVAKWERVTDPTTGKPKPFGFCKYMGAEAVLRAVRLLNGLEFDGGALLLKVSPLVTSPTANGGPKPLHVCGGGPKDAGAPG